MILIMAVSPRIEWVATSKSWGDRECAIRTVLPRRMLDAGVGVGAGVGAPACVVAAGLTGADVGVACAIEQAPSSTIANSDSETHRIVVLFDMIFSPLSKR